MRVLRTYGGWDSGAATPVPTCSTFWLREDNMDYDHQDVSGERWLYFFLGDFEQAVKMFGIRTVVAYLPPSLKAALKEELNEPVN